MSSLLSLTCGTVRAALVGVLLLGVGAVSSKRGCVCHRLYR